MRAHSERIDRRPARPRPRRDLRAGREARPGAASPAEARRGMTPRVSRRRAPLESTRCRGSSSRTTAAGCTTTQTSSPPSGAATTSSRPRSARCRSPRAPPSPCCPGRRPVGIDPATGERVVAARGEGGAPHPRAARGRRDAPARLHAHVPPRGGAPAARDGRGGAGAPAVGLHRRRARRPRPGHLGAPHRSARATGARAPTPRPTCPRRVEATLAETPNPIYRQLARCALEWRCFTAQNTFYLRDEGAIPSSSALQRRLHRLPLRPGGGHAAGEPRADRAAAHGGGDGRARRAPPRARHRARDGELRAGLRGRAAHALAGDRARHPARPGPHGPRLASTRTRTARCRRRSAGSSTPGSTRCASRPTPPRPTSTPPTTGRAATGSPTSWRRSALAKAKGAYVALNLLTFPGVTDREGEVEALCRLVRGHRRGPGADAPARHRSRRLHGRGARARRRRPRARDPRARGRAARGAPGLVVGNFSRARSERGSRRGAGPRETCRAGDEPRGAATRREDPMKVEAELRLQKDLARHLRAGHPWVFRKAIEKAPKGLAAGAIVDVTDDGRFVARGYFDPHSAIQVRVLTREPAEEIDARSGGAASRGPSRSAASSCTARPATGSCTASRTACPASSPTATTAFAVLKLYSAGLTPHRGAIVEALRAEARGDPRRLRPRRDPARRRRRGGRRARRARAVGRRAAGAHRHRRARDDGARRRPARAEDRPLPRPAREPPHGARPSPPGGPRRSTSSATPAGSRWPPRSAARSTSSRSTWTRTPSPSRGRTSARTASTRPTTPSRWRTSSRSSPATSARGGASTSSSATRPPSRSRRRRSTPPSPGTRRSTAPRSPWSSPGGLLVTASCSARVSVEQFTDAVKEAAFKARIDLQLVAETRQPPDHPVSLQFREGRYLKCLVLRRAA